MDSTAYNRDPLRHNAWNILHSTTLHGIHCIPSGSFGPCCIKSTAFNRDALGIAAWTPLHSIRMHFTRLPGIHAFITLHGLHCIQSGSIAPQCMEYSAFNDAPWNPLHSIGMLLAMHHKIHCIQRRCMESTEFNWDTLY